MIKDYVTAKERLTFKPASLYDFYIHECVGCGMTTEQIAAEYNCTFQEVEDNSVSTNSGLWYCGRDCYRDSH